MLRGGFAVGFIMRPIGASCSAISATASAAAAAAVLRRLQEGNHAGNGGAAWRCHLGRRVAVGGTGVLRVCASAALVNRVAASLAASA